MSLLARGVTVSMLVILSFACTKATKESNRANSTGGDDLGDGAEGESDIVADGTGGDEGEGDLMADDADGSDDAGADSGTIDINVLAAAYPEGLAVAMVPEAVPAAVPASIPLSFTGALAVQTSAGLLLDDSDHPAYDALKSTFADKVAVAGERLAGDGDCFDPAFLNVAPQNPDVCYTPDTDLNFALNAPAPGGTPISQPRPTTTGGEACMTAYARAKMVSTIATVDRATGFLVAMLCQAKKAGITKVMPAVGDTLDMKTQLTAAIGDAGGLEVESATIKRFSNFNGHLRFLTTLTVQHTHNSNVRRETINLLHAAHTVEGNGVYYGRLWISSGMTKVPADPNPQANFLQINYERGGTESEPLLTLELIQGDYVQDTGTAVANDALFGGSAGTPFDANGNLDLNFGADFSDSMDPMYAQWAGDTAMNRNLTMGSSAYIAFAMNPLTSVGKLMYWQNYGGNYPEAARGMVFNLDEDGDNRLKGCSVSGAALGPGMNNWSIRKAQKYGDFSKLKPTGYYHPNGWTDLMAHAADCPLGLCQTSDHVYRQCFTQNDAGKYVVDNVATTGVVGYKILQIDDPLVTEPLGVVPPDVSNITPITQ